MVCVWLRPGASAITALGRRAVPHAKTLVLHASIPRSLALHHDSLSVTVHARSMATKGKGNNKKKEFKKSLFDKVEEEDDPFELPDEVKFLGQEAEKTKYIDVEEDDEEEEDDDVEYEYEEDDDDDDDDDDEDDEDDPAEWARKFELDVAEWDDEWDDEEDGEFEYVDPSKVEDDLLYKEMPDYDASLFFAESQIGVKENEDVPDPFENWDQGMAISPEMLNWMLPADKRKPFTEAKVKPWKYFVAANHPDVVELALDVDLLRLFISPTGRIRPRRFTGLTAKQQRKLARAVKISRQLALLPYLSRYPEPTPEQWKAIDQEIIAAAELEADNEDDIVHIDDFDEDFDEDFEYE